MALPSIKANSSNSRLVNPEKNLMLNGFEKTASVKISQHPLAVSESQYSMNKEKLNYSILSSTQGIQAPLKLMMERKAATQVGHLPFISSSNAMMDTLTGNDLNFGPEDMFNDNMSDRELMGPPHLVMERHLDIL